jgi:hypothetical protein
MRKALVQEIVQTRLNQQTANSTGESGMRLSEIAVILGETEGMDAPNLGEIPLLEAEFLHLIPQRIPW